MNFPRNKLEECHIPVYEIQHTQKELYVGYTAPQAQVPWVLESEMILDGGSKAIGPQYIDPSDQSGPKFGLN